MSPSPESGGAFLHQKNPELHTSGSVTHEQDRKKLAGEDTSHKPAEKLNDWMRVLERTHTGHRDNPRVLERIKELYHREFVIAPEDIPEGYFENQQRLARELGHGDVAIDDAQRTELAEVLISDQESTLDL